jgi:hypothetical protein
MADRGKRWEAVQTITIYRMSHDRYGYPSSGLMLAMSGCSSQAHVVLLIQGMLHSSRASQRFI